MRIIGGIIKKICDSADYNIESGRKAQYYKEHRAVREEEVKSYENLG